MTVSDRIDNYWKSWIGNNVIKKEFEDCYPEQSEIVEAAQQELISEYKNVGWILIKTIVVLFLPLILIDHLHGINPQIYGLFLTIIGGMFIVYPSLNGKYGIAILSDSGNIENKIKLHSQRTAFTNAGFLFLILGFVAQLIGITIF